MVIQFIKIVITYCTIPRIFALMRLGLLRVVFFRGRQFGPLPPHTTPTPFIFQEELIFCKYNFIQLLSNLFKVGNFQSMKSPVELNSFTVILFVISPGFIRRYTERLARPLHKIVLLL